MIFCARKEDLCNAERFLSKKSALHFQSYGLNAVFTVYIPSHQKSPDDGSHPKEIAKIGQNCLENDSIIRYNEVRLWEEVISMKKLRKTGLILLATAIFFLACVNFSVGAISVKTGDATYESSGNKNILYLPASTDITKMQFDIEASKIIIGTKSSDFDRESYYDISGADKTDVNGLKYYYLTFKTSSGLKNCSIYILSELPSVYVSTSKGTSYIHQSKENRDKQSVINICDATGKNIYSDSENNTVSEIKTRGNATAGYEKKPYQIKLGKKTDLFGMGKAKTWILLANYIDASFIKNSVAYELAGRLGFDFTPETKQVNLYIDGRYMGLYCLAEKVQINKQRINITDLEDETDKLNPTSASGRVVTVHQGKFIDNSAIVRYSYVAGVKNPEDITGGYLIELDYLYAGRERCKFTTKQGNTYVVKSPENASKEQVEYIAKLMGDMEDALYSDTGYNYLGKHYSEYCDVDSMLKVYAVNEITKNWDSYVGSTFFHKDRDKDGKTALIYGGPVWDYDNAFANLNRSGSNNGKDWDFGKDYESLWANGTCDWYKCDFGYYLTSHGELKDKLRDIMQTAINELLEMNTSYVDELSDEIYTSAMCDRFLYGTVRGSVFKQYDYYKNGKTNSAVGDLQDFINKRCRALAKHFGTEIKEPHVHEYGEKYICDGEGHVPVCTGCGKELEKEAHVFTISHDENYHWNVCEKCHYESEKIGHTVLDGKCTVCGVVVKTPETVTSTTTAEQTETTASPKSTGCGSFVGAGASVAGVMIFGAALVLSKKKKNGQ